jgi:hypothetical protein
MSISKLYFSLLPENNITKAYTCMCFIKDWLHQNGLVNFKAETIFEASEGMFDVQLIGTTLRNLKCSSKDIWNTIDRKRVRRKYWNAESVYSCYDTWGIPAWNNAQCQKVQPIHNPLNIDKNATKTAISAKRLDIMVGSTGHIPTLFKKYLAEHNGDNVDYYSYFWKKIYSNKYDFRVSYSFINRLDPLLIETHNARGKTWLSSSISKCLELPKKYLDKDNYPVVNPALINKLELPQDMYNLKSFPTNFIYRLVAMTNHPTLDWNLERGNPKYLTAHHKCHNSACVNPDHLMPIEEQHHSELHNKLRDPHAYNDPNQHFQVVEKSSNLVKEPSPPNDLYVPIDPDPDELDFTYDNTHIISGETLENDGHKFK